MLKLSNSLLNVPVMSLRTGGKVASALRPLINPNNLKIEGWFCEDNFSKSTLILLARDVRDFVPQGLAINDHDDLSVPEELVRLQDVIELNFELIGKSVVTDQKRRLGKVNDYALDTSSMVIQKLYVTRPMYRSLADSQLSIDRSQIIEITNRRVLVRDADEKVGRAVPSTAPLPG
jgi:sporulation protein YlmC with PRC-barrel domain